MGSSRHVCLSTSSLSILRLYPRLLRLHPLCFHSEDFTLHNSAGEVLVVQSIPKFRLGQPTYDGNRGELHEALYYYAKAVGVEIRLGQNVSEYWEDEENGTAGVVANGERISADMVVGADGARSKARTLVLVSALSTSWWVNFNN